MADFNGGIVGGDSAIKLQAEQITTFNSTGTLTTQPATTEIEYLVVAGGGGAGGPSYSGGGGAGGFRTASGLSVSGGASYPVTVGAGGAGNAGVNIPGTKGSDSILSTPTPITSEGGGYSVPSGGYRNSGPAGPGGSGGGTGPSADTQPNYPAVGGTGVPGQGNPGGGGDYPESPTNNRNGGAGGGGAGGAGNDSIFGLQYGNVNIAVSGPGGNGLSSSITGSTVYY